MSPCKKKAIHKRLVEVNNSFRKIFNIETRIPIFNVPSEHFYERLEERAAENEHNDIIEMIVRYVDKNARTIANRPDGELILNSRKYSVKMNITPVTNRPKIDNDERNRPVSLIHLVTITSSS